VREPDTVSLVTEPLAEAPIDEWHFRAMGTDVTVLTLDGPADAGRDAAAAIEELEAHWSRFRPDSELCRLNAAAGAPVLVSADTYGLIDRAVDAWRTTGGRYDPTVLAALEAAGYDRSFESVQPSAEPPGASGPAPGCAGIVLDPVVLTVRLPRGMTLDLGGIGKGFAADLVARDLVDGDAQGALVNLGGDLRAVGRAPAPAGWVVEVDDPLGTGATGMVAIAEGAVVTSTRLRRTWDRAGVAMHHIIDPRTGRPADTGLASVTVLAGEAWRAEVLAKAAFLAGVDGAAELVAASGATGLLVTDDGEVVELAGLAAYRP
jgi:thiamine biosynthesis lipoprotein